jgi:hypothetical protein
MIHFEYTKTHKPPRPCTANDLNFGGECFNCGFPGENIIKLVKSSDYGCKNCLWASCECTKMSKYQPEKTRGGGISCKGYTYYD